MSLVNEAESANPASSCSEGLALRHLKKQLLKNLVEPLRIGTQEPHDLHHIGAMGYLGDYIGAILGLMKGEELAQNWRPQMFGFGCWIA